MNQTHSSEFFVVRFVWQTTLKPGVGYLLIQSIIWAARIWRFWFTTRGDCRWAASLSGCQSDLSGDCLVVLIIHSGFPLSLINWDHGSTIDSNINFKWGAQAAAGETDQDSCHWFSWDILPENPWKPPIFRSKKNHAILEMFSVAEACPDIWWRAFVPWLKDGQNGQGEAWKMW